VEALAGIGAGILALVGYPSYLRGVRAGTTRPAIASWWAWLLSAVVVTGGQLSARSGWALLLAVAQTTGLGAIAVVAQRRATWRPSPTDMACIAVAVLGAVLGLLVASPDLAVGAAIVGNVVAGLPTYRSVWARPGDESPWLWLCCGAAGGLSVVAAPAMTVADAGYGVYILIADVGIAGLALRGLSARQPSPRASSTPVAERASPSATGVQARGAASHATATPRRDPLAGARPAGDRRGEARRLPQGLNDLLSPRSSGAASRTGR
jgi:hypothetical protein